MLNKPLGLLLISLLILLTISCSQNESTESESRSKVEVKTETAILTEQEALRLTKLYIEDKKFDDSLDMSTGKIITNKKNHYIISFHIPKDIDKMPNEWIFKINRKTKEIETLPID